MVSKKGRVFLLREAKKLYSDWYSKGYLRPESAIHRYNPIVSFLSENKHRVKTVLDAGCGRCKQFSLFTDAGFDIEGTHFLRIEAARENRITIHNLSYQEIWKLKPKKYDAVISCDVLEHLFDIGEARRAVVDLFDLADEFLFISVGLKRVYPEHALNFDIISFDDWNSFLNETIGFEGNVIFKRISGRGSKRALWYWDKKLEN